jgi:hypothetical protein
MTQSNIDHSFSYMPMQTAAGRLFSLIIPSKKSAKNKAHRRSQGLCLPNLPNGIFLSHSIGAVNAIFWSFSNWPKITIPALTNQC